MENREPKKKVAVLHNDGLYRIMGTFDPSVHEMREFVEFDVLHGDGSIEHVAASLWKVLPRYILYRQTIAQQAKGRLGEFHPSQR